MLVSRHNIRLSWLSPAVLTWQGVSEGEERGEQL